jgi:hypothetical protein
VTAGDLITAPWQVEWRGVLWGWPATTVGVTGLSGWLDLPGTRGGNSDRPGRHGSIPGQKRLGERVIEVELTADSFADPGALALLQAATALDEDPAEEPLVMWQGTDQPQLVMARLDKRAIPTDQEWSVGDHRATLQWVASDPRRYSVTEYSALVGLLGDAGGSHLAFPLNFPLDFGAGTAGISQTVVVNGGKANSWPIFEIAGPVTGPIITNSDTGAQLVFDPEFTIAGGQTVTVYTDARAVTLDGVPRADVLQVRGWFPVKPGSTRIAFSSVGAYDVAAQLKIRWRWSWQ